MTGTIAARLIALACLLFAGMATQVQAEDWPSRPVKVLIPFTPGGTADTLGRIVGQKLSESLGQQFIMENRTGGGGLIAAEVTAKAPPDGYNLVVSGIGGFIIIAAVTPNISIDIVKDFTHIAILGGPPSVLVVRPDMPKTLSEFVSLARTKPAGIDYGSPSAGSHSAMIADLLQQKAGIKLTHIPYKGASQALTDMLGGHLPAASMTLTSAAGQLDGGKVRALAISSPKRVADYPDIPTYAEQGFPDIVAYTWFSLSGPANMPKAIVDKLNAEVVKAFKQPDVVERLKREAIYTEPFTSEGFTAFFIREKERWTPIAKAAGFKPE
jgi:tripartite-type tricarboxylate transporter receptor subunit TctC